ncbi:hypothetical protein PANNVG_00251 [Pantoea sp. Nvir]|uniref:HofO family protein n=1 Tax=Pantoea TaxID=53335 RepID=UPI000CDD5F3E|nr:MULTISPECIES: hypothetical protein [Pantoea]POW56154.1 hypothetical protein C3408_15600 [Pantoea alvi]UBN54695.1 hypothetical protein LB453_03695 [Pantoea agglomerans]
MNSVLERWFHLPLRQQTVTMAACCAVLALAVWLLLLRPQRLAQQALRADIARLEQQYQQRLAQLRTLPDEAQLRAQLAESALPPEASSHAAPLDAVLAARGSQLEAWQPESEPRALTLLLGWEQFLPLFAELARTTTPSPARFLLEARQGKVQAKLWLESDDAR